MSGKGNGGMNRMLSEAFLVRQFRDFYSEVTRLKHLVAEGSGELPGAYSTPEETARSRAVTVVWQRLLSLLEQQELAVTRRHGDYGGMYYKEAQYVMAALADETFLHLDWAGKAEWQTHLLETRLFDSQSAGEVLFQKLERLLHSADPVYAELAAVYLMALALGFQGKFRGDAHSGQLTAYRRQLYAFITRRAPELRHASRYLFPEAHAHTLEAGKSRRLPTARRWVLMLCGVMLLLGSLSHLLWMRLSTDLRQTIAPILRTTP